MIAVNLDDPWVRRAATRYKGEKITYGSRGRVRAESRRVRPAGGLQFTLHAGRERARVRLNFLGQHNITNALGAAAMAYGTGIKLAAIRRGLESVRPFAMRMQLDEWNGIGIINDAYNANPASMEAALKSLAGIGRGGARIAVLGDMFELGKHSRKQHLDLGAKAAAARVDWLYLLGQQADAVRTGAVRRGLPPGRIVIGADHADLAGKLRRRVKKGDWLLFKGSRASAMEKVLNELKAQG
jgi:UDP-N-acetylmuramyl pentapeptide synthase